MNKCKHSFIEEELGFGTDEEGIVYNSVVAFAKKQGYKHEIRNNEDFFIGENSDIDYLTMKEEYLSEVQK